MKDLAYELVANAVAPRHLPPDVVEVTKKFILDTIGTAVAGSRAPGCGATVGLIKDWAGKKESTVMVYGGRLPAVNAAYLNATMCQALDLDDVHDVAILHANVSVLPAALAVAERRGGVSGEDLIEAVAVGVDAVCRIGLGVIGPLTFGLTFVGGYFGAAIAAGKILGLSEAQLHNAVGIAFAQCAGSSQPTLERALVKRMQGGFASRSGVLAALLAQRGITGPKNVLEGRWGLYPLYFGGKYDRSKVDRDLGTVFEGTNLSIKFHIGGRYTHPCNDVAIELAAKHGIKPEDVAEVVAHVPEISFVMVGKPFELSENPQVEAQFSIPYGIALGIARGHVFIEDFDEDRIRSDKSVLELAAKVRVIGDMGSIEAVGRPMTPVVIDIRTRDGKVYSRRADTVSGSPGLAPMERVLEKFRKCCGYSARPMSAARVENLISTIDRLETLPDVSGLLGMTVGRSS